MLKGKRQKCKRCPQSNCGCNIENVCGHFSKARVNIWPTLFNFRFTAPVDKGIIFVLDSIPKLEDFEMFDALPQESLEKINDGTFTPEKNAPTPAAAFFGCSTTTFRGNFPRYHFGKFILLSKACLLYNNPQSFITSHLKKI